MPLPKPNSELIQKVLRERTHHLGQDDSFSRIQEAALLAISDGALTDHRARDLALLLELNPKASGVFPNNLLAESLRLILQDGAWTPEAEHDLLLFIFSFYSDPDTFEEAAREMVSYPTGFIGDIYPWMFDNPPSTVSLKGTICDFTGTFRCGTRKKCFEIVEAAGGAPSKNIHQVDIVFVAQKHVDDRVVSSTMLLTMVHRQRYGHPLMMTEEHFPANG